MERVDIEVALHRARIWQLETYASLPAEVLDLPATRDEHDPSRWWTPKDHLAHSHHMVNAVGLIVRHFVFGDLDVASLSIPDRIAISDPDTMASIKNMADLLPTVHARTHEIWAEHHDKSFDEVVALGEESYAQIFSLLASIDEDQLANTVIARGPLRQTIGEQLATLAGHDRLHWSWAIKGLTEHASETANLG
jgi:hypothetical protein